MNKSTKWLIFLIVALMLISLACGGGSGNRCQTSVINSGSGNVTTVNCNQDNYQSGSGGDPVPFDIMGIGFAVFGVGVAFIIVVSAAMSMFSGTDY